MRPTREEPGEAPGPGAEVQYTASLYRYSEAAEPLDEYDFSLQPEIDPRKVKDLATLSFVETKANAALLGPPGVGKTHIAIALAVAACRAGYSIYFTSLDDMVRNLKAAEAAGRLTSKAAPTNGRAFSWWTKSATSLSNAPRRTWSSR